MSAPIDKSAWKKVKFGDVVRKVSDRVDPERDGLQRYVAGEHMDTDDLHIRRWGEVGDGYLGPAFHMRFKPGHVLYGSRRTYLRKVAVAAFEGVCANTTFVLEPSSKQILPEYLPLIMTTEAFHAHSVQQSKGSVNPYVNFSDLTWYEFLLPPIDEQKRIADLLWSLEEHLESLQRLAHDSQLVAESELSALFSTSLGPIGVKVQDIAHINPDSARELDPSCWPRRYADVSSVFNGRPIDVESLDWITKDGAPSRAQRVVRKGDIIVSTVRPNLRAVANILDDMNGHVVSSAFTVIRPTTEANRSLLWALVESRPFTDALVRRATGTNYPAVSDTDIANVKLDPNLWATGGGLSPATTRALSAARDFWSCAQHVHAEKQALLECRAAVLRGLL